MIKRLVDYRHRVMPNGDEIELVIKEGCIVKANCWRLDGPLLIWEAKEYKKEKVVITIG